MHLTPDRRRAADILGGAILLAAVFVAYLPAMSGGYIWDDDFHVPLKPALRTLDGLSRYWFEPGVSPQYYPLMHTTLWLEARLFGVAQTTSFHAVNAALHGLTSLLLWAVLRRLGVRWAFVAACVFALHPVHVQSVAWISQRKNTQSALFYLLAALAYLRFDPLDRDGVLRVRRWAFYTLAALAFVAALLSKTVTCTLPAVVALLIYWKRGRLSLRDALPLVPLLLVGLGLALVTIRMEKDVVGARGAEWAFTPLERAPIAGRVVCFYFTKLVWPHPLMTVYPRWSIDAANPADYAFPLAALGVTAGLWCLRRRIGRGALVAALYFMGTLLPALGFIDVYPFRYSFVADHYVYLASLGVIVPIVAVAGAWWEHAARQRQRRAPLGIAIAALLPATLGGMTWSRAHVYRDADALWQDAVLKNPQAWVAQLNLGHAVQEKGRLNEAIACYEAALRLRPEYDTAHYDLGIALEKVGRAGDALRHYREALRIKPDYYEAQCNLAMLLLRSGQADEATRLLEDVARKGPHLAEAQYQLGVAYSMQNRLPEALAAMERAVQLEPAATQRRFVWALFQKAAGQYASAEQNLRRCLSEQPDNADVLIRLSLLLSTANDAGVRRGSDALALARRACERTGDSPAALDALAAAHAELGDFSSAARAAAQARDAAARDAAPGNAALAEQIAARLALYRAGQPARE
ncbi:MAG: Beta-barrel assembly-enhancing protease [Phycisphaerae bacterium]|nr:Beta-barrel assembly-enhancing protease [Phycisphaerae bacterium]